MTRAVALLLIAACQDQRALPPPTEDPGVESMLMLAFAGNDVQWATAFDLDMGHGYPPIAWRGDDVDLVAVAFGCPIERLGLEYGRQQLIGEPTPELRLPAPIGVMSTPIDAPSWKPAEMSDQISAALRRLELPEDNVCRTVRAVYNPVDVGVPVDGHLDPAFVLPYDKDSALVGSSDGKVYRVHRDTAIERIPALEDRNYRGAYLSPRGELWLLSDLGTLAEGTIDGVESVSSTTAFGDNERIAVVGPRELDAPFEIFATSRSSPRVFMRFDGAAWEMIARGPAHDNIFLPAAAWLGPGRAVAIGVGPDRNTVVRYENGSTTFETLPTEAGPSSIMNHPTLGLVVGMDDGTMAVRRETGWEALEGGPLIRYVRTLSPVGDGFIFGASSQFNFLSYSFGQYHPSIGFCEGQVFTPESVAASHLAALGPSTLIAATLQGFDSPFGITILELALPADTCSAD